MMKTVEREEDIITVSPGIPKDTHTSRWRKGWREEDKDEGKNE